MPKIILPKSEIEKFLSLATYSDVTSDSISYSPITEYILINISKGFCRLTLTSQSTFISSLFSYSDNSTSSILISYLELRDFFKSKRADNIQISQTEKKTSISDGVFTKTYQIKDGIEIDLFPKQLSFTGKEFTRMDGKMIELLFTSKKFIKDEKKDRLLPGLNHSTILGEYLLASDAHISFYYHLSNNSYPHIFFTKSEIDLIKNFDYFDFLNFDGWNIIKYKTTLFCKRNVDGVAALLFPQLRVYKQLIKKDSYIKLPAEPFYNFCKSIIDSSKDENVNCHLIVSENGINLTYNDIGNSNEAHQFITCEVKGFNSGYDICFVQSNIIKVLDSINSETINLSECVEESGRKGYVAFWYELDNNFCSICSKGFEEQETIEISNSH